MSWYEDLLFAFGLFLLLWVVVPFVVGPYLVRRLEPRGGRAKLGLAFFALYCAAFGVGAWLLPLLRMTLGVLIGFLPPAAPFLGIYLARKLRMPDHAWKIGLILFCLGSGAAINYFAWPPKLGIDLSGGVILVYELQETEQQQEAPEGQQEEARRQAGLPWYLDLLIVLAAFVVPFAAGHWLAATFAAPGSRWRLGVPVLALGTGVLAAVLVYGLPGSQRAEGGEDDSAQQTAASGSKKVDITKLIAAVNLRVNPGGQKEVTVRPYGVNQIEVIIPQVDENEAKRIEKKISKAGTLEFRILANTTDHLRVIERARAEPDEKVKVLKDANDKVEAWWVEVRKGEEGDFQWQGADREIAKRTVDKGDQQFLEILVVKDPFDVTGDFLDHAETGVDQKTGKPCVDFFFNTQGGRLFGGLTGNNRPVDDFTRKLGIILDRYLYSAPSIQTTIYERGQITSGRFTNEEVEDLVEVLNAGSLPTALSEEPISRLQTGPILGRDTIQRGSWAIGISMVLVLVFMLFYYRFAGMVACLALLTNLVLILAIMITIKAAFTLPGLAGLVLTVGMSVDANVLIFERIREEVARGAALRMAIRNGFSRATSAIVDANLTTLIVAVVLWSIGTDQVKGFAVVLFLGVVLCMFTAIFCSRVLFDIAEKRRWISALKMLRILGKTQIDFISKRYLAGAISVLVIMIGLVGVGLRRAGLLDIDFTGGVSVEILFDNPQNIADVRKALGQTRTVEGVPEPIEGLPDLAVSDVQIAGEPLGKRFRINTSQADIMDEKDPEKVKTFAIVVVEEYIQRAFPGMLSSMEISDVTRIEAPEGQPGATPEEATAKAAEPATAPHRRDDLPPDSLLAQAGPSPLWLARADAAQPEPATGDEAADEPSTETPGERSEETPEMPPAEPAPEPSEEGAEAPPAEPPAEPPTETPPATAEQPPAKPAAETPGETPAEPPAEPPAVPPEAPPPPPPVKPPTRPPEAPPAKPPSKPAPKPSPEPPGDEAFAGGTRAKLTFAKDVSYNELEEMFTKLLGPEAKKVRFDFSNTGFKEDKNKDEPYGTWDVRITLPQKEARKVFNQIEAALEPIPVFPSSNTIGGKVAGHMQQLAMIALFASLVCIVGYIWIRFQRAVFGLAAVIALVHDVLITLGVIALSAYVADYLGFLLIDEFKIGLPVLAAFLTIIGYSLNDTIVVFDRIREVRGKSPRLTDEMVNTSINQTLSRTLLTSMTTLIVVLILYVGGGQAIHAFAFALVIGVVVGTYSSIFVASPALLWMSRPPQAK